MGGFGSSVLQTPPSIKEAKNTRSKCKDLGDGRYTVGLENRLHPLPVLTSPKRRIKPKCLNHHTTTIIPRGQLEHVRHPTVTVRALCRTVEKISMGTSFAGRPSCRERNCVPGWRPWASGGAVEGPRVSWEGAPQALCRAAVERELWRDAPAAADAVAGRNCNSRRLCLPAASLQHPCKDDSQILALLLESRHRTTAPAVVLC